MLLRVYVCTMEPDSPEGCPKLNPVEEVVVVLLPNTEPCPKPELCWPNAGVLLWPNSVPPVLGAALAAVVPNEKELALPAAEGAPNRLPPLVEEADDEAGWAAVDAAGWPKAGAAPKPD